MLAVAICISLSSFSQSPSFRDSVISAMSKLSFLTGHWEGSLKFFQDGNLSGSGNDTVDIAGKNNATIIQIDVKGNSRIAQDSAPFHIMQVYSYDPEKNKYMAKTYGDYGKQIDEEVTLLNDHTIQQIASNDRGYGFEKSTITVKNNSWKEILELTKDGNKSEKYMEINLVKK